MQQLIAMEGTPGRMVVLTGTDVAQGLPLASFRSQSSTRAMANSALVTVEGADIRFAYHDDDVAEGHALYATDVLNLNSAAQVAAFRFVNADNAKPATVRVTPFW